MRRKGHLTTPAVLLVVTLGLYTQLGDYKGLLERRALRNTSEQIIAALKYHATTNREGIWDTLAVLSEQLPDYASTHEKLGDVYAQLKDYPHALSEYDIASRYREKNTEQTRARQLKVIHALFLQSQGEITPTLERHLLALSASGIPLTAEVRNLLAINEFQHQRYLSAIETWLSLLSEVNEPVLQEQIKQLIGNAQFHYNLSTPHQTHPAEDKVLQLTIYGPPPQGNETLYVALYPVGQESGMPIAVARTAYIQPTTVVYLGRIHQLRPWPEDAPLRIYVKISAGSVDEAGARQVFMVQPTHAPNASYAFEWGAPDKENGIE